MLSTLEQSVLSKWLLESNSIWAYPTVITLHTMGLMVLVGAMAIIDLRLLGFGRGIALGSLQILFNALWAGFGLNAATGVLLFAADATKRGSSALFLTKLGLIAAGLGLVPLIKRHYDRIAHDPGAIDTSGRWLALGSLLVWGAAVTAGRLLAYV